MEKISDFLLDPQVRAVVYAIAAFVGGIVLARLLQRLLPVRHMHPQHQLVVRRVVKYVVIGIAISWSLRLLGVSLGVLMGTAGILTVAIGFASQTSASNLISGLFLMAERPFVIGDVIKVAEITGTVVTVDLLSVRLRTFDNLLVRIPNETMLKSNVTNLTHFPIRRLDMTIGVAYKEDLERVRKTLESVAKALPICLEEPKPLSIVLGYGDSAVNLQFSVWAAREKYLELRSAMHIGVKRAFEEAGIEIPFPHRKIVSGVAASRPTPSVVDENEPQPAPQG